MPAPSHFDRAATFVADERTRCAVARAARAAADARRGAAAAAREAMIKSRDAAAAAAEVARQAQLRVSGGKARRNRGSLPFDPVSQTYAASAAGAALHAADEARAARAGGGGGGLVGFAFRSERNPITWGAS
jgi:hypothetical protein